MNCPICGLALKNKHICPDCDENAYVLNKIFNISVRLYNKALQKSKENEFSNAIFLIERSLCFNKNNFQARNLLGLLYYKVGRLGDATKQWILSSNINTNKNNRAFYYINTLKEDMRKLEKLDDAVKLYNQAIQYLKNKDDDLAIITLKKALEINNEFIDAMNLLSLCYILQKKYKKALKISNDVLLLDVKNKISLKYIDEINLQKNKNTAETLSEEYIHKSIFKKFNEDEEVLNNSKNFNIKNRITILSFLFGVLLCGLVMYFLIMPKYISKITIQVESLNNQLDKLKEESNNILIQKDNDIKKLQQENNDIKNQLQIYIKQENINKIDIALNLYNKGKKTEAKDIINNVNTNGFDEENLKKYNNAKNKINK